MKKIISKLDSSDLKNLLSSYVVFGDEPLQIEKITDQICNMARSNDFLDKESHVVTKKTDWSSLLTGENNLSLFNSKKIIEIKLIETGPGREGSKKIREFLGKTNENLLLIVTAERLDYKSESSVWARLLESSGMLIKIPSVTFKNLPKWIKQNAKENNVEMSTEAVMLLTETTEGNLQDTYQEIQKLALLYPNTKISIDDMEKTISGSSKYSVFDLSNSFISGNRKRTIKILEILKAEGAPEPFVLWAFSKELNNLLKTIENGSSEGVIGPRKYLEKLEKLSKKVSKEDINTAIKNIAKIDLIIKGLRKQNAWQAIRDLALVF